MRYLYRREGVATQKTRLLSLCTGYGGLDLAVEAFFDCELVACAEIDKYASLAIDKHFKVPNLGDIKLIDWASLGDIDIMTAGYPCQPFSTAGKRRGTNDDRHIWPYIQEGISVLRPSLVILENVRGHLSLGFKEVLKDLTGIGYDAIWTVVRASDIGAPHRRERMFVFVEPSDADGERHLFRKLRTRGSERQSQCQSAACGQASPNTHERRGKSNQQSRCDCQTESQEKTTIYPRINHGRFESNEEMSMRKAPNALDNDRLSPNFVEYMMGLPEGWITKLDLSRTQKLKLLGNGVVPQQAFYALETLWKMRHAV